MKTVLVMCLADPAGDPRPRRAIEMCADAGFRVDVLSYPGGGDLPIARHFEIPRPCMRPHSRLLRNLPLVFRLFHYVDKERFKVSKIALDFHQQKYDLIIVEDLMLLPLAMKIRDKARVIFDAREFYPAQQADATLFKMVIQPYYLYLCSTYLHQCDAVITVSPGLAAEYKRTFGIDCHLIRSTPAGQDRPPMPLTPGRIRMVHHGAGNRNRCLENMIDVFEYLDERFELDFYLVGKPAYLNTLKHRAAGHSRIRFHDPVPFLEIGNMLAQYDIGIFFAEPVTFNLRYCLPNKLFEFIQARLMVAIGPSPDMAEIVKQYQLGIVADSFRPEDIAQRLNSLTAEQIENFKKASHEAAKELCWEKESSNYVTLIDGLLAVKESLI